MKSRHVLARQMLLQTSFLPVWSMMMNLRCLPVWAVVNLVTFDGSGACSYEPLTDNLMEHCLAMSSIFFNVGTNSLLIKITSPIRFLPLPFTIRHFSTEWSSDRCVGVDVGQVLPFFGAFVALTFVAVALCLESRKLSVKHTQTAARSRRVQIAFIVEWCVNWCAFPSLSTSLLRFISTTLQLWLVRWDNAFV